MRPDGIWFESQVSYFKANTKLNGHSVVQTAWHRPKVCAWTLTVVCCTLTDRGRRLVWTRIQSELKIKSFYLNGFCLFVCFRGWWRAGTDNNNHTYKLNIDIGIIIHINNKVKKRWQRSNLFRFFLLTPRCSTINWNISSVRLETFLQLLLETLDISHWGVN